jgi:hypothetical protein
MTDLEKREYDDVIRQLMAKVEQLAAENAALKAGLDAHSTLKSIYGDSSQPAAVRVRAAQAALGHESAPLKPVEPAIDATCEEIEPLADVVSRQRKRADQMLALPPFSDLPKVPFRPDGNGHDDAGSDD